MVQSALVNHVSNTSIDEGSLNGSDLECLYSIAMKNGPNKEQIPDINNNDAFINMINAISNYSKENSKESQVTKLWLIYIEYIYIVEEFLVVERTCNWYLRLQVLVKMTNLFAVFGRKNYPKVLQIVLRRNA